MNHLTNVTIYSYILDLFVYGCLWSGTLLGTFLLLEWMHKIKKQGVFTFSFLVFVIARAQKHWSLTKSPNSKHHAISVSCFTVTVSCPVCLMFSLAPRVSLDLFKSSFSSAHHLVYWIPQFVSACRHVVVSSLCHLVPKLSHWQDFQNTWLSTPLFAYSSTIDPGSFNSIQSQTLKRVQKTPNSLNRYLLPIRRLLGIFTTWDWRLFFHLT